MPFDTFLLTNDAHNASCHHWSALCGVGDPIRSSTSAYTTKLDKIVSGIAEGRFE